MNGPNNTSNSREKVGLNRALCNLRTAKINCGNNRCIKRENNVELSLQNYLYIQKGTNTQLVKYILF